MKYRIDHNRKRNVSNAALSPGCALVTVWMEFSATGLELLVLYSEKSLSNYSHVANTNNNLYTTTKHTPNITHPNNNKSHQQYHHQYYHSSIQSQTHQP